MASDIPNFDGVENDDNDNEKNRLNSEAMKEVYGGDVENEAVKKRSVKRASDYSDFFHISNKKSKVEEKRKRKIVDKPFSGIKKFADKQLQLAEKSFVECHRNVQVKERRLKSLKRDISKCSKELANKKMQVKRVRVINRVLEKMKVKIEKCATEFAVKKAHLDLMDDLIGDSKQELKTKEMELYEIKLQETEFRLVMDKIDKERERKEEEFEGRVKEHESKVKRYEEWVKELEYKEAKLEGTMKEYESKKDVLEGRVKEFESKLEEFECQKKELELEKLQFDSRVNEFNSNEKQLEGWIKEFELENFEGQVKDFESKEEKLESQMKELKLKEKQLEDRMKEFNGQVDDLEAQKKFFESQVNELESKERDFAKRMGVLVSHEEQLQSQLEELKRKTKHFEKEKDSGEQTGAIDSLLGRLRASSDPSKEVLDIIQNPIAPWCGKGHNIVTIDDSHITMMVHLMKMSLHIKPRVREEAMKLAEVMKLALDLKSHKSENSQKVLGFLLLLSIYGLVPSFNEDEVLKLFGFVAQHKIAVKLFGTLGFADKVSDFVQNLIKGAAAHDNR